MNPGMRFLFAIFLAILTISGAFAFPHSVLGGAGQTPGNLFTVAGQDRQCSQYPDETGTFVGSKTITSKSSPALVNVYYVTSTGGWQYYNEFEAPVSFSGGNRQYAYEIYYCPQAASTCTNGQTRAVTETTYQTCNNGQWSTALKCNVGSYFSPQDAQCISTTCLERWSCANWGQCTANGVQYRTCTDTKACGTFKDMPKATQSCTPVLSTGTVAGTVKDGIELLGQPKLDAYEGPLGQARIVTQTFQVNTPGSYWVEAGIEVVRPFLSVAGSDVMKNTCNPEESWYANALLTFPTAGSVTKTFTVTPQANGEYVLHTAIVTGCAGTVVDQVNAADHLIVGSPSTTDANDLDGFFNIPGLPLILLGVVIIGISAFLLHKRRRR